MRCPGSGATYVLLVETSGFGIIIKALKSSQDNIKRFEENRRRKAGRRAGFVVIVITRVASEGEHILLYEPAFSIVSVVCIDNESSFLLD